MLLWFVLLLGEVKIMLSILPPEKQEVNDEINYTLAEL